MGFFFESSTAVGIHYGSLTFNLKPFSFKHTGLFGAGNQLGLVLWKIKHAWTSGRRFELFAYTGGVHSAAAAGAAVTRIDASKGMVTWAKENAASSGLGDKPIRWLVDDCVKFVEREIRLTATSLWCIIMDPPSYGSGPKRRDLEDWRRNSSTGKLCTQIAFWRSLFFWSILYHRTAACRACVSPWHEMKKIPWKSYGRKSVFRYLLMVLYCRVWCSGRWESL